MVEHKNEPRGPTCRFDPHWRHFVVSLSKVHKLPRVLVNIQEEMALFGHD